MKQYIPKSRNEIRQRARLETHSLQESQFTQPSTFALPARCIQTQPTMQCNQPISLNAQRQNIAQCTQTQPIAQCAQTIPNTECIQTPQHVYNNGILLTQCLHAPYNCAIHRSKMYWCTYCLSTYMFPEIHCNHPQYVVNQNVCNPPSYRAPPPIACTPTHRIQSSVCEIPSVCDLPPVCQVAPACQVTQTCQAAPACQASYTFQS